MLILGLSPLFASKYLALAAALFGPPPLATLSQSKWLLALNGLLIALVQFADIGVALIGCADIGVPQLERGEVTSWIDHAGEAGMWSRIRPLEFSGAEAGTFGRANWGFKGWLPAVGGGDFMEHPDTDSIVIDDNGVMFSEAGTDLGESEADLGLSSDDVEFEEIDSTVIFD